MNNFNFLFPKSKKLDLDKIKKFSYQKHYLANDYSNLAYLLNNLVMSDLNEDILPFEKEITFKEYNAIIDIFKISLKHIHILQNNNTLEIDSLYKSFCKKNDMLNKIKQQKNELINRTSDLNEKMSEILTETEIFCEKIKNIEYKYMCPECLQIQESQRSLHVHLKGSHNIKIQKEAYPQKCEFEEKEVQTKTFEETENATNILESYRQMEDKIEKKFNENIEIIRKDMDNQTKTNEKQTKEFQLTLRILEEKKAEKAKQKENNRNLTEEKHVIALQTLESNIKQNNEVFTSFQNLVLSFHQNETKKLEDISSTIANMKTSDTRKRSESLDEGEIDQTLQEKMLDHLELLENKLKSSSKKPRKIQKTPLKILAPSKEWAIGELESDKDSQEDAIYSSELFSNTLRSKSPLEVIQEAEIEFKGIIESKYKGKFERSKFKEIENNMEKMIGKNFKATTKESLKKSNKKEKSELEKILEEYKNSNEKIQKKLFN